MTRRKAIKYQDNELVTRRAVDPCPGILPQHPDACQ